MPGTKHRVRMIWIRRCVAFLSPRFKECRCDATRGAQRGRSSSPTVRESLFSFTKSPHTKSEPGAVATGSTGLTEQDQCYLLTRQNSIQPRMATRRDPVATARGSEFVFGC